MKVIRNINLLVLKFISQFDKIGVSKILVALMAGKAEVYYDKSKTSPSAICEWITSLGFPSKLQNSKSSKEDGDQSDIGKVEVELEINGMTCSSCVYNIESNIMKMDGMIKAAVALATHRGIFAYDPDKVGPRQIIDQIKVRNLFYVFIRLV